MKTVHEVSSLSGVSIRTLHHYDAIGLLKPSSVTEAGYRLYDETALARLQIILMFRELGFPLADIRAFLDNPDFDLNEALDQHIEMLKLKRTHIDALITAAYKMKKGETVGFMAFNTKEMDTYAEEVKRKWGQTEAYRESLEKTGRMTETEKQGFSDGLMERMTRFGTFRNLSPDSPEVQNGVKELQEFITANCYTCTKEILAGLGVMYTADARFRENIDRAGGEGTAAFLGRAIQKYCQ